MPGQHLTVLKITNSWQRTGRRVGLASPSKNDLRIQFLSLPFSLLSLSPSLFFRHMFEIRHNTCVCVWHMHVARLRNPEMLVLLPAYLPHWLTETLVDCVELRQPEQNAYVREQMIGEIFFTGQTGAKISWPKKICNFKPKQKKNFVPLLNSF